MSEKDDPRRAALEAASRLPARPSSRWHRAGLGRRAERVFEGVGALVLMVLGLGWTWSIGNAAVARSEGAGVPRMPRVSESLVGDDVRSTVYLTDAALRLFDPLRGESGALRAHVVEPGDTVITDSLPGGAVVAYSHGDVAEEVTETPVAPEETGVWRIALRVGQALRPIADLNLITLTPLERRQRGRIGPYYIGTWPSERTRRAGYTTPTGMIEVTLENRDTHVSEHFRLRDFLTKGQDNVWPKYLVLDMRLVDKLELVIAELEASGTPVERVTVMSGFRTPQYNTGGGDTRGRATFSRHMYGDASDVFVDNDADGNMDDLNGDGRVNIRDAEVIRAALDRVERAHPKLVGGAGVYPATSGHGPFIHVDTRGYRARWTGSGDDS